MNCLNMLSSLKRCSRSDIIKFPGTRLTSRLFSPLLLVLVSVITTYKLHFLIFWWCFPYPTHSKLYPNQTGVNCFGYIMWLYRSIWSAHCQLHTHYLAHIACFHTKWAWCYPNTQVKMISETKQTSQTQTKFKSLRKYI